MNILLIERYSQLIQDIVQYTDDILRQIIVNDKLRQDIKYQWYSDSDIDWNAIVKAEEKTYTFDPSIYPDNFFNE